MIDFKQVIFEYPGGARVINNLNLRINSGERAAVLGNNGSGKTTFALLINGILKPAAGEIRIADLNPADNNENALIKKKVGLVFQNPDNQLVSTTVEREIAFSLENSGTPQPEMVRRVDDALKFFGLENFRSRLTAELSGGEKQKVALAAVMAAEPEILILDEPGSYLDESGKRLLTEAVGRLMQHNRELTVIRITQFSYVTEIYDRVILFKDGAVLLDGHPDQIFSEVETCRSAGISVPLKYRLKAGIDFPRKDAAFPIPSVEARGIALKKISFSYDGASGPKLFDNLNLEINSGLTYGIVGRSGSGKSTLIQLMAGLLKPDTGEIFYSGFNPVPGDMAICFQHPERQFFLPTVDRELRFGAENLKLDRIDEIVSECYRLIGLSKEKFADRDPFSLSGGEKRRLAFGTVLSLRPSFVFFDEPTCGLDAFGIRQFIEMAGRLRNLGVGIIIVSHYGEIIYRLADRVIALNNGELQGIWDRRDFFLSFDYTNFLSRPELFSYQLENDGCIESFSELELAARLS